MKRKQTGKLLTISTVGGETCKAFIPDPLPPKPKLRIDADLQESIDKALLALGRLDTISDLLPDASLFLDMYIRKEAVLSSQIEGTQSSLSDLLMFEGKGTSGVPVDDVREVSNYVAAITYGLERIRSGFPLSLRLIREIHGVLLSDGRGSRENPGEFRKSQNWIGGTRPGNAVFVPPPPDKVVSCMGDLEKFLHNDPVKTPVLLKAALSHVQFESTHPFLDGNGRLGRLLITLLLCSEKALAQPTLYLSLFLKSHRQEYYDHLQAVRTSGDWEGWIQFFLTGVQETAQSAVETARRIVNLFDRDRQTIEGLGRAAGSAVRVHIALQQQAVMTIAKGAELTQLSVPTVTTAVRSLIKLGIVQELERTGRSKYFSYAEYLRILNEGTEQGL